MADPGNGAGNETGNGVTTGAPLSNAERQARFKARKRAERAAAGDVAAPVLRQVVPNHPPFEPGNSVSVTHGAQSESRVIALRDQLESRILAHPDCPAYLRDDLSYRPRLRAMCRADAIVLLLEAWLDKQSIEGAMSELTTGEETEVNMAPGSMRRQMRSRRVASVLDQLHKHETRAMHLATRLGLDPLSRARMGADLSQQVDAAKVWEQMWERKQQERGKSA